MPGNVVSIASRRGGYLGCYLATPAAEGPVPGVVLASAVHGVDADLRAMADEFAERGFIAAAPDLFARSRRPDASQDARSRVEQLRVGEADMADALAHLRTLPGFNGCAAAMGLCYGGPYAIVGPRRLGYAAGIACHGSQMLEFVDDLEGITQPICVMWGDRDHRAPAEVLEAYRASSSRMNNIEVHVLPGVRHGYMLPGSQAFDVAARDFSMTRALALLEALRGDEGAAAPVPAKGRVYEVERRSRLAERPGLRISELQISPTQSVPWHYHSHVQDTFYVLEGTLRISLRDPAEQILLGPGETHTIRPGRPHQVANAGEASATFFVLQGIGEFDFIPDGAA